MSLKQVLWHHAQRVKINMRAAEFILTSLNEVKIDNRDGAGAVPYNKDVDYFGMRVMMRPSTFLKLAAPLGRSHDEKLEQYIAQGGAIGAPFFMIDIPEGWEDGDFSQPAEVTGHEGRNRMSAVLKVEGDAPVEVHLFPRYKRARNITSDWIKALNRGLIAEGSGRVVAGPLFEVGNLEEGRIAPHEGRELELMARGEKPAALVSNIKPFLPGLRSGKFVAKQVKYKEFPGYRGDYFVATTANRNRIGQMQDLMDRRPDMELDDFHQKIGRLLGYNDDDIDYFIQKSINEGWREKAAAAATAATLAYGGMHNINKPNDAPAEQPSAVQRAIQKIAPNKPAAPAPFVLKFADKNPVRDYLVQQARRSGFGEIELAHLVSQVQHETMNFKHFEEIGTPKYFARKYDKRYNPRKARILGNVKPGDGERFKGRGFVHLTGRDNYTRAGRALGVDLVNNPQLAADPKVATDIALWFWKNRVQPKVDDFTSATVAQVTKPINPGLRGLQDREAKFQKIANR